MKTKQFPTKIYMPSKPFNESNIQETAQSIFQSQKIKNQQSKIDTTVCSLSQNQISTGIFFNKDGKKVRANESTFEFAQNQEKSRKQIKKKKIEKKKILRSNSYKGKFANILRSSQAKRNKERTKKSKKNEKKAKNLKKKQILTVIKTDFIEVKQKRLKPVKKEQKIFRINFDENAEIKMIGFDRKQLQKKRDDLIKRMVEDWNFVDKGRSDKRQLRNLTI